MSCNRVVEVLLVLLRQVPHEAVDEPEHFAGRVHRVSPVVVEGVRVRQDSHWAGQNVILMSLSEPSRHSIPTLPAIMVGLPLSLNMAFWSPS